MEDEQLKAQMTSLQGDNAQLCAQMDQLTAARDGLMRANDSVRGENGHGDMPAARSRSAQVFVANSVATGN
jgi:cell division protein FtsB